MACCHADLKSVDEGGWIAYVCCDCKSLVGGSSKGKEAEV